MQLFAGLPKGVHFVLISDRCHAADLSKNVNTDEATIYRQFQGIRPLLYGNSIAQGLNALNTPIATPLNGALFSAHDLPIPNTATFILPIMLVIIVILIELIRNKKRLSILL